MQVVQGTLGNLPPPARFGRSGRLFFLVRRPAHLSHSVCLPVPHGPPSCSILFAALLFFSCPPSPTDPFFRERWSIAIEFLDGLPTLVRRCDPLSSPPCPSPPSHHAKACLFHALLSCYPSFWFFHPPFTTTPLPIWAQCSHFQPCLL